MFYQILQKLVRQFFMSKGRAPRSAMEWQQLRARARELVAKEGGIPSVTSKTTIDDLITGPHISEGPKGQRIWDFSKDIPTRDVQSRTADVIPFPKGITGSKKVKAMMRSGDIKLGEAPKTLPGTLKAKKDRHILMRDADEDILRMKRENKEAVERFNRKWGKPDERKTKTVEDFRDKGDWDPSGMAGGGIAPLVGEPSYAADFYDDRTPMEKGKKAKKAKKKKKKKKSLTPEDDIFQGPPYETDDPKEAVKEIVRRIVGEGVIGVPIGGGFELGTGYGEDRPFDYGIGYNVNPELGGLYADYGIRRGDENVFSGGYKGDNWDIGMTKEEGSDPTFGFNWKKKFDQGGRARMAGGGVLKKFIEALFIKASNSIRQGKGKWKGLSQEQWIKQHDNLTKKMVEWRMGGQKRLPEGASEYLGMNDIQIANAVKQAEKQVTDEKLIQKAYDEIAGGSGFSGDYKYDADILADSIAEVQGKVYADLSDIEQSGIYEQALKRVQQDLQKKMQLNKLSKPTKTLEGIEKTGTINISDPNVADEFSRFMKESDPKGFKDLEQKIQLESFDPKGKKGHAEGGRAGYIFGGSAGLRALWKHILQNVSKGQGKKIDKFFPRLTAEEKRLEKMVMGSPEQKAFREGEMTHKIEGIEHIIDRLKHDKKILERQAKNKAMRDPGLDFLMKNLEESTPEIYGPRLKKYTDIDKDVLDMETIKKNLIMKDRKLNAYGGRIEYAGGGLTGLPPITQGLPQGAGMQQPPMAAGPQPIGTPGGTIVAHNQMQQNPWMGQQMQQGIGGMPQRGQPRPGGMPRPMASEGGRMPFGLGGMGRRAFLKLMGAGAAGTAAAKTGLFGLIKAGKPVTGVLTSVPIKAGVEGMPVWFKPLVNKIIKTGDEVESGAERVIVHSSELPGSKTKLYVTQELDTGNVMVDVGMGKHGFSEGHLGQPVRLEYKAAEDIMTGPDADDLWKIGERDPHVKTKSRKEFKTNKKPEEFWVEEAEFTGGHPENIKFEESSIEKFGQHGSNFDEVEKFATGKIKKKTAKESIKAERAHWTPEGDMASGGVARMLGE